MEKKNEKINAVKQYIENVAGIYTSYSYGEIPNNIRIICGEFGE